MATTNKGLNQPAIGSTGWATPLNDNATILDNALGAYQVVTGTTGIISLSTLQVQSMCLKSDTLAFTADVTFVVPSGISGQWVVVNQSATNVYNLIVKNAASGTSVSIPNGQTRTVYSDGAKIIFVDTQSPSALQSLDIGNNFTTTNASCSGTNATITFSGGYLIAVGQTISVKGVTPAGYNGIWTVTASSAGSVTFVVPATLTNQTVAGTLYYGSISGSTLNLSGKGAVSGVATQTEATTGTDNTTLMTPLRTAQALNATVGVANSALVKTSVNATGDAPIYACRAWVNFDGQTTPPTIRSSGNVSSVTRTSTGIYVVNFTTALPDGNYAVVYGGNQNINGSDTTRAVISALSSTGSSHTLQTGSGASSGHYNFQLVSVAVFY